MLVSNANQLADVDDVFNAVLMKGDMLGDVVFYGKGAGKRPLPAPWWPTSSTP